MPVNARARSFPVTIRETSSRPSGAASIPTLMRSRLTLGCANKALQQAEPIKRLVSGCRQVIAARNTYSRAKSVHLRTQKIAEPVVAARDQRPPARACGSWPPNRLAQKTANLTAGRHEPVARDDQRHQISGHGLTGVTVSSWVKNPGFPMEIRAPRTAVKIARSSVEEFSQGQSVRTPSCLSKHLSRKAIASTPELANTAPFPVAIDSFLMGPPDYIICHYDRERTMILHELHNSWLM